MPVEGVNGILNVESSALHAPQVGIANTNPQHILSVGSNLFVSGDSSDVLTVTGNVVAEGLKLGFIEIYPSFDLEAITTAGNVTSNTLQFNNATTGFVTTANIEVGTANLFVDTQMSRIGVGTRTPGATLHVAGDTIITGNLNILGTTTTIDTENLRVKDPIIELGKDNVGTGDLGFVMTRPTGNSNVAVIFGEDTDTLEIGYTQGNASQSTITMQTAVDLKVNVNGTLTVSSNLEVGTANLFVDTTTGNVGIGTASPTSNLHVVGDVAISSNLAVDTNTLFVDSVGNKVGIGTTNPGSKLDVNDSTSTTTNKTLTLENPHIFGFNTGLNIGNSIVSRGRWQGDGVSDIIDMATIQMRKENNANYGDSYLSFQTRYETDRNSGGAGTLSEKMRISGNGNVGIGKTNPGSALDVVGDVEISSNLAVDTNTLFVDSVGNKVGIGTTTPATYLHLSAKNSDPGATEGDGIGTHTLTEYLRFTSLGDSGDVNSVAVGFKLGADDNSTVIPNGRLDICANNLANENNSWGAVANKTIATFLGSGNVGIGTTNPTGNLQITSDLANADDPINPVAQLVLHSSLAGLDDVGDIGASLVFTQRWSDGNPNSQGTMGSIHGFKDNTTGNYGGGLLFKTQPAADTPPVARMVIDRDGNVGIGTTNPGQKLDVVGNIQLSTGSSLGYSITDAFTYDGDSMPNYGVKWREHSAYTGAAAMQLSGYHGFRFFTQGTEKVTILPNGNVGIGGTNIKSKLHITHVGPDYTSSITNDRLRIMNRHQPATPDANSGNEYGFQMAVSGTGNSTIQTISYTNSTGTVAAGYNLQLQPNGGNVGIGTVTPGVALDVNGTIRTNSTLYGVNVSVGSYFRNADFRDITFSPSYIGAGQFKVGFDDFGGYVDVIGLNTYTDSSGGGANAIMFYKNSILARQYQLTSTSTSEFSTYKTFDMTTPSDDRLKDNEEYIRNATDTLMKLKPQIYDLKLTLTSDVYERAAGVIVQDVWYDTPELRFLVKPGYLSQIPKEAPKRSDDPRDDPDYSKWGEEHAELDYDYFIPYIIKSIQEVVTELPRSKTQVSDIIPSNVDYYRGMLVSADTNEFKNNVPKLSLTKQSLDKKCYGVVSSSNTYSIDNEILIDTKGPGKVWVINHSNIESGDYLTSSNVHGYAMKQEDDVLHNYTVAKTTMDCDFNTRDIIIKRVKQELKDVTYYVKETLSEITKEKYDTIEDVYYKKSQERSIYVKTEYESVDETAIYDKLEYSSINDGTVVSVDEWNVLESNVQSTYTPRYLKEEIKKILTEEYSTLDETKKSEYESTTEIVYYHKYPQDSKNPLPEYTIEEVRQEYVNVLDEHGQIQWEDTDKTETVYNIRYLDANGVITDEANTVHTAAFVGCTYHCG